MTQECARKREREKRDYKVNNDTKVFPLAGNQSKKISKNVITKIIVTGRATFQRKKEAGEGRRERETKQNAFDERGKREFKRDREKKRERICVPRRRRWIGWIAFLLLRERKERLLTLFVKKGRGTEFDTSRKKRERERKAHN